MSLRAVGPAPLELPEGLHELSEVDDREGHPQIGYLDAVARRILD
jgi:hypothetical protein